MIFLLCYEDELDIFAPQIIGSYEFFWFAMKTYETYMHLNLKARMKFFALLWEHIKHICTSIYRFIWIDLWKIWKWSKYEFYNISVAEKYYILTHHASSGLMPHAILASRVLMAWITCPRATLWKRSMSPRADPMSTLDWPFSLNKYSIEFGMLFSLQLTYCL